MSKAEWKKWVGVVGRVLLAYALVFAPGVLAGQNEQAKDKPARLQKVATRDLAASQKPSATAPTKANAGAEESESAVPEKRGSDDAAHQGIKVHGHWTIEVRNPDGTLVSHREFENALTSPGALYLAGILTRTVSVGAWAIDLGSGTGPNEPCTSGGSPSECSIVEGAVTAGPPLFPGLSVKLGTNGAILLAGTATAGANGSISVVSTRFRSCVMGYAGDPGSCTIAFIGSIVPDSVTLATAGPSNPNFTAPIPVQVNQSISATVVISFS